MRFMSEEPYDIFANEPEYSRQKPNNAALNIQHVELCFSSEDAKSLNDWLQLLQLDQEDGTTRIDNPLLTPELFRSQCQQFKSVSLRTWRDKFERIAILNLRHLTLDLTEASAPDGEYLGVEAVQGLIPFAHGVPDDFRILAPSQQLVDRIRDVFYLKNS